MLCGLLWDLTYGFALNNKALHCLKSTTILLQMSEQELDNKKNSRLTQKKRIMLLRINISNMNHILA